MMIETIIDYTQGVVKVGLWVALTALFCLTITKFFLREGVSRLKLIVLSVLTSPAVLYCVSMLLNDGLEELLSMFVGWDLENAQTAAYAAVISVITAAIYFGLILLSEKLIEKRLRIGQKQIPLFLYLMFNTILVISVRGGFDRLVPSKPVIGQLFDTAATLIMFFATWLFYRLVVQRLSFLAQADVRVNWRIFTLPPTVFVLLNTFFTGLMIKYQNIMRGETILIVYVFSIIILFLFIWAFYVIIKNISAANEIKTLSVEVMEALAHTIDAKDEYTRGHSVRVAKYSRMLAEKMGLPEEQCENVYYMGLLHDIGKIGVPNEIINSPTKLTDEQYDVIKTHPGIGFDILAEIKSRPELSIGARWHHERFDGCGYPDRKTNQEIPLEARIIAVADSYDAMTSNRSYRKYMPQEKVRSEIEKNAGKQFDPNVAETMLGIIDSDVEYALHE